jgi:hypothetical protein
MGGEVNSSSLSLSWRFVEVTHPVTTMFLRGNSHA